MHFDQRTQRALRDAGLSTAELQEVSEAVVTATEDTAERIEEFFDGLETIYSDMEMAHAAAEFPEHALAYVDLFTHAEDIRGFVRFETWGASVEGGRILDEGVVELALGPTIHDRVRFARDRSQL